MQKLKKNKPDDPSTPVELNIESMAFGGKGIARSGGKVFFVTDAIAGDRVLAKITKNEDRFCEAEIVSILEPSSHRGASPCLVSERCGGCQWQGVSYGQQLEWKRQFIYDALKRIGKLNTDVHVEMLPSATIQEYRNRILLRARIFGDGRIAVGYFRGGSRDFIEIKRCEIANPRINRFIESLESLKADSLVELLDKKSEIKFRFEVQDLPSKTSDEPHLLVTVYDPDDPKKISAAQVVRLFNKLKSVYWVGTLKDSNHADLVHFEDDSGRAFYTSPNIFQQVNVDHNHTVRALVLDFVNHSKVSRILDLFCGSGNLSLALANDQREILGVEFSKRAIDVANFNVKKNEIKGAEYRSCDTELFLKQEIQTGVQYDLIIADPPRDGMYKSIPYLLKLKPRYVIYISCDPTTLSRDLSVLCKEAYKIVRFVALDFFPNTYHVESFVILERVES